MRTSKQYEGWIYSNNHYNEHSIIVEISNWAECMWHFTHLMHLTMSNSETNPPFNT
jgi:hypothetical protein